MPVSEPNFPGANATSTGAGTAPGEVEHGDTANARSAVSIHVHDDGTKQSLLKHDGEGANQEEDHPGMENGRLFTQETSLMVKQEKIEARL